MVLLWDFAVLIVSIPGSSHKVSSSSVKRTKADVRTRRQNDVCFCPGSGSLKMYVVDIYVLLVSSHRPMQFLQSFWILLHHNLLFCISNDHTCLWFDYRGSTVGFLLLQRFRVGLAAEYSSCFSNEP